MMTPKEPVFAPFGNTISGTIFLIVGVIEAEQTEDQKTTRDDRLIAVAADSRNHSHVRFLGDLNNNLVHEIERFFISYNETKGRNSKFSAASVLTAPLP
jgi:inorganic pyrophosphatase